MTDRVIPDEARAFLRARAVPDEDIAAAEASGTLHLLVLDRLLLPAEPQYTAAELAENAGMTIEQARRFWRALGFPDVPEDEVAFTDHDLNALTTVNGLIHFGVTDVDLAVQMTRVIGQSMARIAESSPDPVRTTEESARLAELYALTGGTTIDSNARLLDYVWRRHYQAATRRRTVRSAGSDGERLVVGFADLVGFTALSQQLSEAALANVVSRFEEMAYDVIAASGGRVVKMIGDEVMFVTPEPSAGAEIGLTISEQSAEDENLSEVRVGMACGQVLALEGDYYGPVVNLASRVVNIARPGSVLVSEEMREELYAHDGFALKAVRPRYLKDIGRVPLWSLTRAEGAEPEPEPENGGRRRRRRIARRPGVLDLLPDQVRMRIEREKDSGSDGDGSGLAEADGDDPERS